MLEGKVALITGASRGIGKATAIKFAENGAAVIVNYHESKVAADSLVEQIESMGGKALAVKADVKNYNELKEMFNTIKERFGRLDILVNNAGVLKDGLIMMTSENDWENIINTNLKGVFNSIQIASKIMMKQGGGRIINVSSIVGTHGNAGQVVYSASKAGVIGITKSAAKELAPYGISVNCVAPGLIDTDMTRHLKPEIKDRLISNIYMKRMGRPEDVANVILFLASDLSNYVNGQTIGVDGCQVL